MGTEYGVAGAPDVTPSCAHSQAKGTRGQWLYPCALQVPGPQHILDKILQGCLERLALWPDWEAHAKAVSQWLHAKSRRDILQQRL